MRRFALFIVLGLAALMVALPGHAELPQEDFTHVVIGEEMTATWCQFCPSAAENLNKVYRPKSEFPDDPYYHDQFFFVALITDVNDKAQARYNDYREPVSQVYPNVYFDGGDEEVTGGQSDTSDYENAIDNCGSREDTDISLRIAMQHAGGDTINVQVWITWNEDGGGIDGSTFNGYLRVYITEVVSRYDNYDDNPYHFGFMDYAFDQQVELDPHTETEFTTTWSGSDYQDTNGDDFSDLSYDNLALMAAIFDDESLSDNDFALQTAHAIPPEVTIDAPDGNLSNTATITGTADAERSILTTLEYRIDDGDWQAFTVSDKWSFDWDTTTVAIGDHNLAVRATDENGTTVVESLQVTVHNDLTPPEVAWLAPADGETVANNVTLEAQATDDAALASVIYRIGNGEWETLIQTDNNTFSKLWNTREVINEEYLLEVRAIDAAGNIASATITVTVANEGDETYPTLSLTSPTAGVHGAAVELVASADDPDGLAAVEYRIDDGSWRALSGGTPWVATWNAYGKDGTHTLTVRATDTTGLYSEETVELVIDTLPPALTVEPPAEPLTARVTIGVAASDPHAVAELRYRIEGDDWVILGASTTSFEWDTTTVDDGSYRLEVEATDTLGNSARVTRTLEVVNQGLVASLAPGQHRAGEPLTVNAYVNYPDPQAVWLLIDGQRLPMTGVAGVYTVAVTLTEPGNYPYTVEIDTGHGLVQSHEQTLTVGDSAPIETDGDEVAAPPLLAAIVVMGAVALGFRRRS